MARRSSAVQLTLLPVLATAAVASMGGVASADDGQVEVGPPGMAAPGMTAPAPIELAPPGMTPTIFELDCADDPNWQLRNDCPSDGDDGAYIYDGGAIRGGFGTYFYGGGHLHLHLHLGHGG
jgi:hypothetical protein